jgi:hypothetical protein
LLFERQKVPGHCYEAALSGLCERMRAPAQGFGAAGGSGSSENGGRGGSRSGSGSGSGSGSESAYA